MNIIKNKKGLSRLEFFCIIGIVLLLALLIYWGIDYYRSTMASGNDSLRMNTAESVASNNLLGSMCVVDGCKGGDECTHVNYEGYSVGYYDSVSHHIEAEKMKGYNEHSQYYTVGNAENAVSTGEPESLIIKVYGKGSDVELKWVEGDK